MRQKEGEGGVQYFVAKTKNQKMRILEQVGQRVDMEEEEYQKEQGTHKEQVQYYQWEGKIETKVYWINWNGSVEKGKKRSWKTTSLKTNTVLVIKLQSL